MKNIIIVGNGSTANTVYQFIQKYNLFNIVGFAVNKKYHDKSTYLGYPNFVIEDLNVKGNYYLFVAAQWNRLNKDRRDLYTNLKLKGFKFANIISPYAIISGRIEGDNCWIADQVVIDFNTVIHSNVYIKVGVYISTNCVIQSHCFIGAKSMIAGACSIGEQSFIGIHSTIFDEVNIGDKCLVGACSVIKRNLPSYSKYINKYADVVVKQYDEDVIESKLLANKNIR